MVHQIKVPRPALGIEVLVDSTPMELIAIDTRTRTFDVKPFNALHPLDARLSLDTEYFPAPTRKNFDRALDEWDMEFRMSDDHDRYEEGLAQQKALIEMFTVLPESEKIYYKKLWTIMQTKL